MYRESGRESGIRRAAPGLPDIGHPGSTGKAGRRQGSRLGALDYGTT
jgi:hypothetical protein